MPTLESKATRAHALLAVCVLTLGACKAQDVSPANVPVQKATEAIATKEVSYQAGATALTGFLAEPKGAGKHPGILVVHEWWGQNEYARSRARQLAELGYVALAVDMYGDGKTTENPEEAGKLAGAATADLEITKQRFEAGRAVLASNPRLDAGKIAAIGYCFGGGVVLNMVRMGVPLDAIASFHGALKTQNPARPGSYHGKVLIETGGADPMVPQADVDAAKAEMLAAGADVEVNVYPGALHAFTNPKATLLGKKFQLPIAYDKTADEKSWVKLRQLLRKTWPAH
ncbi:MAG: dienelactone hydrolase family protein [Polyangiaceae bacterium]|nr:dienelactone hydrolase family protein [Polyangiaceae bacterium]